MNPPIIALSPVSTKARALMLPSRDAGVADGVGLGVAEGVADGLGLGVGEGVGRIPLNSNAPTSGMPERLYPR